MVRQCRWVKSVIDCLNLPSKVMASFVVRARYCRHQNTKEKFLQTCHTLVYVHDCPGMNVAYIHVQ